MVENTDVHHKEKKMGRKEKGTNIGEKEKPKAQTFWVTE